MYRTALVKHPQRLATQWITTVTARSTKTIAVEHPRVNKPSHIISKSMDSVSKQVHEVSQSQSKCHHSVTKETLVSQIAQSPVISLKARNQSSFSIYSDKIQWKCQLFSVSVKFSCSNAILNLVQKNFVSIVTVIFCCPCTKLWTGENKFLPGVNIVGRVIYFYFAEFIEFF